MDENNPSQGGDRSISVLERFRKLKKEQEQPSVEEEKPKTMQKTGTVFEASTSATPHSLNGNFFSGNRRGGFHGKRSFQDYSDEGPRKRIAADTNTGQKETDCGITEFLREGPGFIAILKNRYTDFQVNEIDLDGNVVRLTSTEVVSSNYNETEVSQEEDPSILSPENWKALGNMVDNKLTTTIDIDVTGFTKEKRTQLHKAVKRRFGVHIFSNTKEVNEQKVMRIGYASTSTLSYDRWPSDRPEYLHFVLCKENCDTAEAINLISRLTHVKSTKFGYAGTKDKRAVTTQWVCARRADLKHFKACAMLRGIAVGNFCYKWNNIRLGDLRGNRFKIVLRRIQESDEGLKEAIEHLEKVGFINYFGLQRFGKSINVPTYAVGKAILQGDWKTAVELILKPRPGEASYKDLADAREIWWETRNASDALKKLSRKDRTIEGKLLIGLRKHGPNAYQNAFDNLPRQTGTMYLHAYQSLVWNKVVSRRVREFGVKVLPGDLVKVTSSETCQQIPEGEDDNCEDIVTLPPELSGEGRIQVRALSEQEAAEASIYDVMYPLPGDDIHLPANQIAEWYNELLQADGYSMSSFGKVHKKYGMYGTYRHILEKPEDVSWQILHYSDPDQDLLQSDLAVMKQEPPLSIDSEGPYKALLLEFNLKVCCYATMAVRELAKCETSIANQTFMSQLAKEEHLADQARREQKENGDAMETDELEQSTDEPKQPTPDELLQQIDNEPVEEIQTETEADNTINT